MRRFAFALALLPCFAQAALPIDKVRLPPGFRIEVVASELENARSMARSPGGTLFVGTRGAGNVYALRDADGDGRYEQRWVLARGLNYPNGVAFRDGALYVAEVQRLLRFDGIESRLAAPPKPVVVTEFPAERHHGWRYIAFGPDGKLYVPFGAPCNVCDKPEFAVINRMDADGRNREVVARGVRNTVGFDWHPQTGELWFTDNGRDMLGDDEPACELNRLSKPGQHFGFPYCHGGDVADPEHGAGRRCADFVAPALKLGPHVAPLGVKFYTGSQFPPEYRGVAFIAEHGSWNRSRKIGYRISMAWPKAGGGSEYRTFADGFLQGESAWGRPVDLLVMPDGSLLVSDDHGHAIYRISYTAPR
jgi:glucose/arabinose dehydrogenase